MWFSDPLLYFTVYSLITIFVIVMNISTLKEMPTKKILLIALFLPVALTVMMMTLRFVGYSTDGSASRIDMVSQIAPTSYRMSADNVSGFAEGSGEYESGAMKSARMIMPPIAGGNAAPTPTPMIIKNADLTLLVEDVDASAKTIDQIRIEFGGQVGSVSINDYYSTRRGDITLWVPSAQLDSVIARIKSVALRVTSEHVSASDVSAQFVDLEARLRNQVATEAQYVQILKRSGTIADVLSVQRELSQTREVIEQLQGQLNYLSRQVALSSIHLTLTQEVSSAVSLDEWRPLAVMKSAFHSTLRDLTGFADFVLTLLVRLPVFLLEIAFWGGLVYALWRLSTKVYRHLMGSSLPLRGTKV